MRFTREEKILSKLKPWSNGISGPILFESDGQYYTDDPAYPHHFCVTGRTRAGKTTSVSIPTIYSILQSNNSAIIVDSSKGELYKKTVRYAEQQGTHRLWHVNFNEPWSSPDSYNSLWEVYWKLRSPDPQVEDDAYRDAMQFQRLIPRQDSDRFWEEAAGQTLAGLILTLIEAADEDEINLMSLQTMLSESLNRVANTTIVHELTEFMSDECRGKAMLKTMACTAKETAGGIFAVTLAAINKLCTSDGLLDMTSGHSLTCQDLDVDQPFLIYITLPSDGTTAVAGLMITQMVTHFIRLADRISTGKLKHELWCILEEIAVTGPYIQELPEWCSTTLGRNIRFMIISQSASQLDHVFGMEGAREIRDNTMSINFANHDPQSLRTLSDLCGKYIVFSGQGEREYPRMTPDQIAGLAVGQCLVHSQDLIYVTRLPIYTHLFTPIEGAGDPLPFHDRDYYKRFSLEKFVLGLRKAHLDELLSKQPHEREQTMGREAAHQTYTKCLADKKQELKIMSIDEAMEECKRRRTAGEDGRNRPSLMELMHEVYVRRGEEIDEEDEGEF